VFPIFQRKKREIQQELNSRIVNHINHTKELYGKMVALTGIKIKEKAGVLAEKNMAMQQTIGMQLQGIVMKYMQ
jgi:hypothetical protein